MDGAAAVILGAVIGGVATLLAGTLIPLIVEAVRRRGELRRTRVHSLKMLIPQILEVAADNMHARSKSSPVSVNPSPREVRLIGELEMTATEAERGVVMILTMCATASRGDDALLARKHISAALAMLGQWARGESASRSLYDRYMGLTAIPDEDL